MIMKTVLFKKDGSRVYGDPPFLIIDKKGKKKFLKKNQIKKG